MDRDLGAQIAREWKHRALLGFHRPQTEDHRHSPHAHHSTTTPSLWLSTILSMIREKERKNFFEVAAVMHRTPLALHPSHPSIVDALARVPERFERGRTALES